jgi:3-oxoacyl-[acyl-carrier protein] reductase
MIQRLAVVTGASSGTGLEIARRLISMGWQVMGLARDQGKLRRTKEELGDKFDHLTLDVSDSVAVKNAFRLIGEKHSTIGILVNNAAIFKMARFTDCDFDDINRIIDVNLKGALFCAHQALPLMRQYGGRIINIASVAAEHGIRNQAIYCASKFGLNGFSEAVAQELLDEGILVTNICPGGINTPLWNVHDNPYPGDITKTLKPEDVAGIVAHVADLPGNVVLKKVVVFPANEWH